MHVLKMLMFTLDSAGRAGLDYAGASMAGGELRRRRAMAHGQLRDDAIGHLIAYTSAEGPDRRANHPNPRSRST